MVNKYLQVHKGGRSVQICILGGTHLALLVILKDDRLCGFYISLKCMLNMIDYLHS